MACLAEVVGQTLATGYAHHIQQFGISQFADGGLLATKPYAASAAYVDGMSDYCRGCRYDARQKLGENACPWNAL